MCRDTLNPQPIKNILKVTVPDWDKIKLEPKFTRKIIGHKRSHQYDFVTMIWCSDLRSNVLVLRPHPPVLHLKSSHLKKILQPSLLFFSLTYYRIPHHTTSLTRRSYPSLQTRTNNRLSLLSHLFLFPLSGHLTIDYPYEFPLPYLFHTFRPW